MTGFPLTVFPLTVFPTQLNTDITSYDSINNFGELELGKKLNDPEPLFLRIEKEK